MRCTTGELAAIFWPGCTVHGHIVMTKTFIAKGVSFDFNGKKYTTEHGPGWWVECKTPILTAAGALTMFPVYDHFLRPLARPAESGLDFMEQRKPLTFDERSLIFNTIIRSAQESFRHRGRST